MDRLAALKRTALFGELDEGTLKVLAERAVERRYDTDEVLFIAGDEARGLYVVVEGAVRAFRESLDGREQVIRFRQRARAAAAEVDPQFLEDADGVRNLQRQLPHRLRRVQHVRKLLHADTLNGPVRPHSDLSHGARVTGFLSFDLRSLRLSV